MSKNGERSSEPLPTLLSEHEAAVHLRVKAATVRAERIRGRLAFTCVGARIFYTHEQIAEYLERQSVPACADNATNASDKSAPIGSARSLAEARPMMRGAAPGTMTGPAKHAVSALAQQTFRRQASSSPNGSSATRERARRRPTKS
jgi:hypothetical protein